MSQKVAIVTGAGKGIGKAVAQTFAKAGICVVINDLNPDRANQVAQEIGQQGGKALPIAGDVANKFQCVNLVESTRDHWSHIDILVNCAHVKPVVSILKMDEWDWNRCFEVNLKGTFFMTQLCGRVMIDDNEGRGGAIVNVSSIAGNQIAIENGAAYCANSAGIVGFSKACAQEFAEYDIRVHTVLAGFDAGTAEKVAQTTHLLCSDQSQHLSGLTIPVGHG